MSESAGAAVTSGLPVARERDLAEMFVSLADTLVDGSDVVLLDTLVAGVVRVLGTTAAGLILEDQKGKLAIVAASSEDARLLELFQLQAGEGPGRDCVRDSAPVVSNDVDADGERWPKFVPAARSLGFRSVFTVPMRLRGITIGALNMFGAEGQRLTPNDLVLAQALADVATVTVVQQRSARRSA